MAAQVTVETFTVGKVNEAEGAGPNAGKALSYLRYLPPDYSSSVSRYPVLYLLHDGKGQTIINRLWRELDLLIMGKAIPPCIVAALDLDADDWHVGDLIGLIAAIDDLYATIPAREGRYIAGMGRGGGHALRCALQHPYLLGAMVLVNGCGEQGVSMVDDVRVLLPSYASQALRVPAYIFAGDEERFVETIELYQALSRKPLDGILKANDDHFLTSPAELRIVSPVGRDGNQLEDLAISGLISALQLLSDQGECRALSPRFDMPDSSSKLQGRVERREFVYSGHRPGDCDVSLRFPYYVYLPQGYEDNDAGEHYPVLYMLHGSGPSISEWDTYWPVLDGLISRGRVKPFIAVAPITGNSYWVDSVKYGPIETTIIEGLLPEIDSLYRTVSDREGRSLLGFSMGGYGALRYSLTYPDQFGSATLLSPALQAGMARPASGAVRRGSFGEPFDPDRWTAMNYPMALASYARQSHRMNIFIIAGDKDWNHLLERDDSPDEAVRSNMEMQTVLLYNQLKSIQMSDSLRLQIVNGGHDIHVWAYGMEEGIVFMQQANERSKV